ncbi:gluconokinase [Chelativorans sp.]|uniref:gluconokinase n=1 Tax=Chelativorans sp. TaxID=2203393 RepID=UPI0028113505|nr:gluconokinase [Chelativorans sp.]
MDERRGSETAGTPPVVVMGVAGCGKTAVGSALAQALGTAFVEGDALHPPENVALMASGQPLTDADRAGWLEAVGEELAAKSRAGLGAVAACSALKRRYRDQLRRANPAAIFLHLVIDAETARRRVKLRKGHFMPESLVESQFAALEPPGPDEAALALDGLLPVDELVARAIAFLRKGEQG